MNQFECHCFEKDAMARITLHRPDAANGLDIDTRFNHSQSNKRRYGFSLATFHKIETSCAFCSHGLPAAQLYQRATICRR
jgi:hypothetical protein